MRQFCRYVLFVIAVLSGFVFSILFHEFGHCVFYWIQRIPCSMSWVKEYPLLDISVQQYSIGSWGGIIFNWILLASMYSLTSLFLKKKMHLPAYLARSIFYGNSLVLIIYAIFLLKGADKTEFVYAQNLLNLPGFSIIIISLIYTVLMQYMFLRKHKIRITPAKAGFALIVLLASLILLAILESYDAKTNWHKYPTIKIGTERLYNEKL